jgi:predicted nucleic acid-binding protein
MRVVLDTNVLVRAVPGSGGPAREALLQVTDDPHVLVISPFMLEEFGEALHYDRLRAIHGLDDREIEEALNRGTSMLC